MSEIPVKACMFGTGSPHGWDDGWLVGSCFIMIFIWFHMALWVPFQTVSEVHPFSDRPTCHINWETLAK
jgi:hypothetical protein